MKNKGFTLIELLAVIVLLSLLIVLGTTSVASSIKKSKTNAYNIDITNFISIVKNWAIDHVSELPGNNSSKKITLQDLIDGGLVDSGKKNPITKEPYDSGLTFCIYNTNGSYRYEFRENGEC